MAENPRPTIEIQGFQMAQARTLLILTLATAVASFPACGADPQPPVCTADAPQAIQKALCSLDIEAFDNEMRRLVSSPEAAERSRAVAVLEKVWRGDRALGTWLPWGQLQKPLFRNLVVLYLGPAVRDGASRVSLHELQEYAIALIPTDLSNALTLMGATDARDQLDLLAEVIRSDREGQRVSAIVALGEMCGQGAQELLEGVIESKEYPEVDQRRAAIALDQHQSGRMLRRCSNP